MKPYGLPRDKDIESPDCADIHKYGLKTSVGGKDYFRNKESKKSIRRRWKRIERRKIKQYLKNM